LVAGLLILYFTGVGWIDSALAIIFGTIIAYTGIDILRKTINNLIDTADEETLGKISEAVSKNRKDEWIDIHNLRILKSGSSYFIDCDLALPWYYNIDEGHSACEELRFCILSLFPNAVVSIHSDSCMEQFCTSCKVPDCKYRKEPFTNQIPFTIENVTVAKES
jgi:divalent metal cation (Fe/Co/Zn/Cd) transporter